jgi:hypothetical protein
VVLALCANAWADDRSEARTHYQAGVKFYASANYRDAIKEFSTAQQLAPADLNNYNLALCYDKLGEGGTAIQYYKEYLNKVPDAPKRAEIEASIARLDAALKSADAKKAEETKKAADDAKKAEDAKKAAEDAKKPPEEIKKVDEPKKIDDGAPVGPTGVGSTGTPSTGLTVSTGDAQLDRVQGIDINAIRDQRIGGASSGLPDNRGGPATNAPTSYNGGAYGGPAPNGQVGMNASAAGPNTAANAGPNGPNGPQAQPTDKPVPKETPVYKKWWFWAVVAVSAYVVYEIATQGSTSSQARDTTMLPPMNGAPAVPSGGFTLHF